MGCFHPLHGFKSAEGKFTKQWPNNLYTAEPMTVPCRQCTGCRAEYSRQWAMRIKHEASLYLHNSFITLTYNNAHLPKDNSLHKQDFQKFMKRLRKNNPLNHTDHTKATNKIRFYHCGEYGDNFGRPHYHAIIFNHRWKSKQELKSKYDELQTLWSIDKRNATEDNPEGPIGFVDIGSLTFESAAYVAGYIQKKINGKRKLDHYTTYDSETGEQITHRQQEYATMSRRPGIGKNWFNKYKDDAYPSDFITIKGRKMKPPKYYDKQYEKDHPQEMEKIKAIRQNEMEQIQHLFTPQALKQKELTHKARMAIYSRKKL